MPVPIRANAKPEWEKQLVGTLLHLRASSQTEMSCSVPLTDALGIQGNLGQRSCGLRLLCPSPSHVCRNISIFHIVPRVLIFSSRPLVYLMGMSMKMWLCHATEKTSQRNKVVAKIRNQLFVGTGSTAGWFR